MDEYTLNRTGALLNIEVLSGTDIVQGFVLKTGGNPMDLTDVDFVSTIYRPDGSVFYSPITTKDSESTGRIVVVVEKEKVNEMTKLIRYPWRATYTKDGITSSLFHGFIKRIA